MIYLGPGVGLALIGAFYWYYRARSKRTSKNDG